VNFDPLSLAEAEFDRGQYPLSILHAEAAIQKFTSDDARAKRGRNVLATSHLRLGRDELIKNDYDLAKFHFDEALKYGDDATAGAAIDLGLDLVYEAHEHLAPADPRRYQDTYQISLNLRTLEKSAPDAKASVESNLAEAALTIGKYDEADQIATAVLQDQKADLETKINMRVISLAARLLKGDEASAGKARQDLLSLYDSLPHGFTNGWSYEGTHNYIRLSGLPEAQKQDLSALMAKAAAKR